MINMIYADIYKMLKSTTAKVLLAITVLSSIIMAALGNAIAEGRLGAGFSGITFLLSDVNVMSILGGVAAGTFICGDFENKTIHQAIACGCSRGKIVISKAVAFFCGVVIMLLPYAVVTGIALGLNRNFNLGKDALGFLYLLANDSNTVINGTDLPKLAAVMAVLIMILTAQLSVCLPLALFIKKPVLVVGIYYAISILSSQLLILARNSKVFDKIYSLTPFGGKYLFMTLKTEAGSLCKALIVSLMFIVIIIGISMWMFRKAEIK